MRPPAVTSARWWGAVAATIDAYPTTMTEPGKPMHGGDNVFEPDEAWHVVAFILSRE